MEPEDQESDDDVEVLLDASATGAQDAAPKEIKEPANGTVVPNKVGLSMTFLLNFPC